MYGSRGRGRGRSRVPKWVNPCGIDPVFMKHHAAYSLHEVTPLSDQELIQNILLSAKNALVHSDDFKEKFVRRTFSTPSWRDHHDTWKEQRYNWLPSWKDIPKHLHDPLDSSRLQKLSVSNIFLRRPPRSDTFYCFYEMASGQKRTELSASCYINSKFPNYYMTVVLTNTADWL